MIGILCAQFQRSMSRDVRCRFSAQIRAHAVMHGAHESPKHEGKSARSTRVKYHRPSAIIAVVLIS
jgi:hypothetical protein